MGADSRARRRTYSPYKPPSKWQTLPICHCEAPKGPWQSREGSHVDRTRHSAGPGGALTVRTSHRQNGKRFRFCHCEEAFRILPYSFFSLQDSFISVPRPYSELPGKAQKSSDLSIGASCWRYLSSRAVTRKVLSAQMSLTSVFGMGTGVPSPQSTPTIWGHTLKTEQE